MLLLLLLLLLLLCSARLRGCRYGGDGDRLSAFCVSRGVVAVASSAANDAFGALDLTALRSGGELRFDLSRAQLIVAESIASGPLPGAEIINVVVVGNGDSIPQLHVTLRLEVDFIMAPALPGDLDSTTITRTRSVSILG